MNDLATSEIYTLSLHDALPIFEGELRIAGQVYGPGTAIFHPDPHFEAPLTTETGGVMLIVQYPGPTTGGRPIYDGRLDRKSTRLNSSHGYISYAVFCLKKKKQV